MKLFDTIIIGGGPAGLSAAIYLARFNRSVLIVDAGHGRTQYREHNENYLGFPEGIQAQKLLELGKEQAERYGAEFFVDKVLQITKADDHFKAEGQRENYKARSIIIATGVTDLFPTFEDYKEYVGVSLFWCITCDGYKTRDKRVVVVGNTNESVVTCLQFLNYTKDLVFVTNCEDSMNQVQPEYIKRLAKHNIPYIHGCIETVSGKNGHIHSIKMADGKNIETDFMFNQQGASPNSEIARDLEIKLDRHNYIIVDENQHTNIPYIYAAGDVTKQYAHQIVTAAHEGSMAAQSANYDLYDPDQRA